MESHVYKPTVREVMARLENAGASGEKRVASSVQNRGKEKSLPRSSTSSSEIDSSDMSREPTEMRSLDAAATPRNIEPQNGKKRVTAQVKYLLYVERFLQNKDYKHVFVADKVTLPFELKNATINVTVMLTTKLDGTKKCTPFVILPEGFELNGEKFEGKLNWMCCKNSLVNDDSIRRFIESTIIGEGHKLLVWNGHSQHCTNSVQLLLKNLGIDNLWIPTQGMNLLNPFRIYGSKLFTKHIEKSFGNFLKRNKGSSPSLEDYMMWIFDAWSKLSDREITESFTACGLKNSSNGEDDEKLYCFRMGGEMARGIEMLRKERAKIMSMRAAFYKESTPESLERNDVKIEHEEIPEASESFYEKKTLDTLPAFKFDFDQPEYQEDDIAQGETGLKEPKPEPTEDFEPLTSNEEPVELEEPAVRQSLDPDCSSEGSLDLRGWFEDLIKFLAEKAEESEYCFNITHVFQDYIRQNHLKTLRLNLTRSILYFRFKEYLKEDMEASDVTRLERVAKVVFTTKWPVSNSFQEKFREIAQFKVNEKNQLIYFHTERLTLDFLNSSAELEKKQLHEELIDFVIKKFEKNPKKFHITYVLDKFSKKRGSVTSNSCNLSSINYYRLKRALDKTENMETVAKVLFATKWSVPADIQKKFIEKGVTFKLNKVEKLTYFCYEEPELTLNNYPPRKTPGKRQKIKKSPDQSKDEPRRSSMKDVQYSENMDMSEDVPAVTPRRREAPRRRKRAADGQAKESTKMFKDSTKKK